MNFELDREKFLLCFSKNVVFENFSLEALENTCLELSLDINHHHILFPSGLAEVAEYYEEYALKLLIKHLNNLEEINGITKKIEYALTAKIINHSFPKEFLIKLSKFYILPQNSSIAIKASWILCDAVWRWAGDTSIDYNYYTKRSLLFSVYVSSNIYYINDDSIDHENTKQFIAESLAKVASIGSVKKKIKNFIPKLSELPVIRMFF